jgi:hypothetical protein
MKAFLLLSVFFIVSLALSCEKPNAIPGSGENPPGGSPAIASANTGVSPTADASPAAPAGLVAARESPREAVLVRGNNWVRGIPGFGVNGFPALSGDYRLQGPAPDFTVYVTMEQLYLTDDWHARPGMGNVEVFQRSGEEGDFAAVLVEDGRGILWTAVFLFPERSDRAGLGEDAFNRLLRVWSARLSYFLFLSASPDHVSLPGAVEF